MLRKWSGLLVLALMGAMATSASAASFYTPLDGNWEINIPQAPYGPAVWALEEDAGVVTGTTEIHDVPGVDITGELIGNQLFPILYILNSEFLIDSGIESVPPVTATNIAIVFVLAGKVQGYAITFVEGVPISAPYAVVGSKE